MKGTLNSDVPLSSLRPQSGVTDKVPSAQLQKRMAENKLEPIGDYLLAWNHVGVLLFVADHLILTCLTSQYFFHPRRISVVLAKGKDRFSGETDDYPPDVSRHSKKEKKKKSSHPKTRSADTLVTAARPYPSGSLLGDLLNPLHEAIHTTVTAPQKILLGAQPRGLPRQRSRARSDSDDSDSSSSSSSESDDDRYKRGGRDFDRWGDRGRGNRIEEIRAQREGRLEERRDRREGRKEDRRARKEDRKEERRARKEAKHGKVKQYTSEAVGVEIPSTRFRLVVCYWDGQEEVY